MQKSSVRTYCVPGLVKQDRVPALEGIQRSLKPEKSMDANYHKEPECYILVNIPFWEEIRRY